jgi:hypothetical protein
MDTGRDKTATVGIMLRVREDLRLTLEQAAKARRVSLNQEIVDRLEYVRGRTSLLPEALELAFGTRLAGLLMVLGFAMDAAARHDLPAGSVWRPFPDWTDQPARFDHAVRAAARLLDAARPRGAIPDRLANGEEDPAVRVVEELLAALRGDNPAFPLKQDLLETIKALLGPTATQMAEAGRKKAQPRRPQNR